MSITSNSIRPVVNIATNFALINHLSEQASSAIGSALWKIPNDGVLLSLEDRKVLEAASIILNRVSRNTTETDCRYHIEKLLK